MVVGPAGGELQAPSPFLLPYLCLFCADPSMYLMYLQKLMEPVDEVPEIVLAHRLRCDDAGFIWDIGTADQLSASRPSDDEIRKAHALLSQWSEEDRMDLMRQVFDREVWQSSQVSDFWGIEGQPTEVLTRLLSSSCLLAAFSNGGLPIASLAGIFPLRFLDSLLPRFDPGDVSWTRKLLFHHWPEPARLRRLTDSEYKAIEAADKAKKEAAKEAKKEAAKEAKKAKTEAAKQAKKVAPKTAKNVGRDADKVGEGVPRMQTKNVAVPAPGSSTP